MLVEKTVGAFPKLQGAHQVGARGGGPVGVEKWPVGPQEGAPVFALIFTTHGAPEEYIPTGGGRFAPAIQGEVHETPGRSEGLYGGVNVVGEGRNDKRPGKALGGEEEKVGLILLLAPLDPRNRGERLLRGTPPLSVVPEREARVRDRPAPKVKQDGGGAGMGGERREGRGVLERVEDCIGNAAVRDKVNHDEEKRRNKSPFYT